MSTPRKNRILISILLLISMMMSSGVRSAQAAPTFNESPVILTGMGITFNGSPTRKIDWTSYDGYAMTAGTATNAGNSNTTDNVHLGTQTAGKWCTTDGTTISCTSNSPLMSFTELDPLVSAWAKAPAKPAYTFNEIGSGSIGATTGYFSGNVGIGKTAPAFALDVNGVVNATSLYVNGSAYIGSQWTTTSTSIYYNTGNVGIGTTNPGAPLHVVGGAYFSTGTVYLNSLAGYSGDNIILGGGTASHPFTLTTQSNNHLILSPNGTGNVGVGNAAPGVKLDVSGAIRATSATISTVQNGIVMADGSGNLYATSTAVATGIPTGTNGQTLRSNGTNWIANNILYNDGTNVGIGTTAPGASLQVNTSNWTIAKFFSSGTYPNIVVGADDSHQLSITWDTTVPEALFQTTNRSYPVTFDGSIAKFRTNNQERMRIDNTGNVGIGITNPARALDVTGMIQSSLGLYVAGYPVIDQYRTFSAVANRLDHVPGYYFYNDNDTGLRSEVANSLGLVSGGVENLTVNASNVGIGLTAPGVKLDVSGALRATSATISTVQNGIVMADGSGNLYATSTAVATGIPTGTNGQTLRSNGTNWLANSTIFNDGTNVGIGTTSPLYKLDIIGSSHTTVRISAPISLASSLIFDRTTGNSWGVMNSYVNGDKFQITKGAPGSVPTTAVMTFDTNGNIGVNNSAPTSKFGISGNAAIGATYGALTAPSSGLIIEGNVGIGTTAPGAALDVNGNANFSGYIGVANIYTSGVIGAGAGGSPRLSFSTTGITTTGTGNFSYMAGNVGVGLTNPGVKLDVSGALRATSATISTVQNGIVMADGSGNLYATSTSIATGLPSPSGITGQTLRSNGTSWIANNILYNDGTNVGIGTTNPTSKLSIDAGVNGKGITVQGVANDGDYNAIGFQYSSALPTYGRSEIRNYISNGGAEGNLAFWVNNAGTTLTERMRIVGSSGNVGIGAVAPTSYFHGGTNKVLEIFNSGTAVHSQSHLILGSGATTNVGSVGSITWVTPNSTSNKGVAYIGGVMTSSGVTNASGALTFATANAATPTERMRIDYTGNIGIGTTAPGVKLHVTGNLALNDTSTQSLLRLDRPYNGGVSWAQGVDLTVGRGNTYPSTQLRFMLDNGTNNPSNPQAMIMALDSGGNVGIGTTNPGRKFEVNGQIYSSVAASDTVNSGGNFMGSGGYWSLRTGVNNRMGLDVYNGGATLEALTVLQGGNVGINNTAPGVKFDVSGAIRATSATISTVQNGIVMADGSGNLYATSTSIATGLPSPVGITGQTLRSNGTSWVANNLLYNDGTNVGVGTTTPAYKLDVNGPVLVRGAVDNTAPPVDAVKFDGFGLIGNRTNLYITNYSATGLIQFGIGAAHNSAPKMTILSSGNVGIGTTNPSDGRVAVVQSGLSALSTRSATNAVADGVANVSSLRSVDLDGSHWANARYDAYSHAWGYGPSATANTAMTISGGGNVGIGTTAPGNKLEVSGASSLFYNPTVAGITNLYLGAIKSAATTPENLGGLRAVYPDSGWLNGRLDILGPNIVNGWGSPDVYISLKNGNVGIGITTPISPLHINGIAANNTIGTAEVLTLGRALTSGVSFQQAATFKLGRYTTAGGSYESRTRLDLDLKQDEAVSDYSTDKNVMTWTNQGNVGINTTNPTAKLQIAGGGIDAGGTINGTGLCIGGICKISWAEVGSASAGWNVNGNDVYKSTTAGNVGIGVTAPAQQLHLQKTGGSSFIRIDGAAANQSGIIFDSGGASKWQIVRHTDNALLFYDYAGTAGTRMAIESSSGNVGIGVTNPINKFQVKSNSGSVLSTAFTTNDFALGSAGSELVIGFGAASGSTYSQIAALGAGGGAGNSLILQYNGAGNVGIGKTNPAVSLDVNGAINGTTITGTGLCIGADCKVGWLWKGAQNGNIYNGTTGAGNVGIGITNPTAKLHVVGGLILNRTAVGDTDYTALGTDYIIAFTSLSAQRTLTLPNALCTAGRVFLIVNETNSGFSVNVDPEGATLIVGQTNVLLPAYNSTPVYCSGSNWYMY